MESILEDHRSADISEELRATLDYLQKMTLHPEQITTEDARALRDAGVSKEAALDAIKVGFAFNLITRLADAFDFAVPDAEALARIAPMLFRFGYRM